MRNIIIAAFILVSNYSYGQGAFKIFVEKEIPEIGKNVQIGRSVPGGYEIFYHPKKYKFYLREIGSKDNDSLLPAYIIIRMIDIKKNKTEDIVTFYNGNDTDYGFPRNYLIRDNNYLVVSRRFSSFLIDLETNKIVSNYKTKHREDVVIEDASDASQGELSFFDKDYLIYSQGGCGVYCINYRDKNNPKELDNYYFWSYRSPFLFIDSVGENMFSGIFTNGKQDNTQYLFKNENLKSLDGSLISTIEENQYLILQKNNDEYLIVDFKYGKILCNNDNKELIDRLIIKH